MTKTEWIIVGVGGTLIVAFLAVVLIFASKSKSSNNNPTNEQVVEETAEVSEDSSQGEETKTPELKTNIDKTINALKEANEYLVAASSLQSEHWTTNASLAMNLFDEETINGKKDHGSNPTYVLENAGKKIQFARESAREDLDTAKRELKYYGEEDSLYVALKNYYVELDSYYNFISTMPQGYSKLTFSQAIAEKNASCQSLLSEVEFNR